MASEKFEKIKKEVSKNLAFLNNKKFIYIALGILLLAIIIFGFMIRIQNLDLLKDQTTGNTIPLALDPFYFLRVSELIIETNGNLPLDDNMRNPALQVGFTKELTPRATVFLYKIMSKFSDLTLQDVNVLSPSIFFIFGIIGFFFLILVLTKSKLAAILGAFFLSIAPPYLYRTLAGFSDHESIGMFVFFFAVLFFVLGLNELDKKSTRGLGKPLLFGALTGFATMFTLAAWGGITKFIFMIFPLSFLLIWLVKFQNQEIFQEKKAQRHLVFFFSWIIFIMLSSFLLSYYPLSKVINAIIAPSALITPFLAVFLISDYLILKYKNKIKINFINKDKLEKYRIVFSFIIGLIISIFGLRIVGVDVFGFLGGLVGTLIQPFGTGRVGETVAENAQPFLTDWMSQLGKMFFWTFILGMILVGIDISKGIGKKKNKVVFSIIWILMIFGVVFSRISSGSVLNGNNFISKFIYFGSLLLFIGYFIRLYFNDKLKIKSKTLFIASWLLFMIIAGKGAIRMLFLITPFIVFMAAYAVHKLIMYSRENKDELVKTLFIILTVALIIGFIFTSINFVKAINNQSKNTGPSANYQWQEAMSWVRENTNPGDLFVHWWDYGYWVQYLGQRPTVTDGGHVNAFWDHLIGRYLLTTPYPETALSFMKAQNASYLLIDQTDLGKYGAYSRIGSGIDETANDRYSWIPVMVSDPSKTQETRNGTIIIYQGGSMIEEDLVYNKNGTELFFPGGKTGVAGVIATRNTAGEFTDVQVVLVYNGQQTYLPIKAVYYNGILKEFEEGINATIRIIPRVTQTNQGGIQMDPAGAAIYLSERTRNSLFAKLYLMNDPLNEYPGVELAHREHDYVVSSLNAQGANLGEFVYFQGFRGPIKIWKVEHQENIIAREEFIRASGEFAEFDDLEFTK
jgi:asparagine N-glycosylation enzyme membrane subunit Stt3